MEPCTVVSVFEQGCIEKGLSYLEGGPIYNLFSPHIGGLADTANSLYAIKKLVFDDKKLSFGEFMKILADNWEGNENLRLYALNKYSYYGNDNDEVDMIAARLLSDFSDACVSHNGKTPFRFPAGVSTFGRQLEWAPHRLATPYGRRAHEVLAANASPTPSTDKDGATAIIKSYCKLDLTRTGTGAALDIKLLGSSVEGEDGIEVLIALMRGFVALGGFFMQIDVADAKLLREAQQHPDDYKTLSVRVSGWNARFVTLNREWQDMVIGQVEK
jgi:formate C-acetyltransferase